MAKIDEITVSVGQTIQVRQYEPRTYSVTIKATLDAKDDFSKIATELKEKANLNVKTYFEGLVESPKKQIASPEAAAIETMPEILTQPNVPKPLHGIAPRTIMGQKWWDATRQKAYESTDFHCNACGVAKADAKARNWLEAHEFWDIDYRNGIAKITGIYPLCHYCHNFIHSGRLEKIIGVEKNEDEAVRILEHGFKVLSKAGLKCFDGTLDLANKLGANTFGVTAYETPETDVEWKEWRLNFEGKDYYSNFDSFEHWQEFYARQNEATKKKKGIMEG